MIRQVKKSNFWEKTKHWFVLSLTFVVTFALNVLLQTKVALAYTRHDGCYAAKDYVTINSDCLSCPIFSKIFEIFSKLGDMIYSQVAESSVSLVAWGFIIWLAIMMIKVVSSVTPVEPSEMFVNIGKQLAKVILVIAFFRVDASAIFGLVVEPVLTTSFSFAASVSGSSCGGLAVTTTQGIFSSQLSSSFLCLMKALHQIVGFIQGVGSYLVCMSLGAGFMGILPAFGPFISGCVLFVTMLIICFNFTLKILDTLFRLSVFCCLMPLMVSAWAFEITKAFAQKGWEMLISICVTFICLALAISMSFFMFDVVFGEGMTAMINAVNADDISILGEMFEVTGLTMVKVIVVCVFSCAIIAKAPAFGDHFAEVSWRSDQGPASQMGAIAEGMMSRAMDPLNPDSFLRRRMDEGGRYIETASKIGGFAGKVVGRSPIGRSYKKGKSAIKNAVSNSAVGRGTKSLGSNIKKSEEALKGAIKNSSVVRGAEKGKEAVLNALVRDEVPQNAAEYYSSSLNSNAGVAAPTATIAPPQIAGFAARPSLDANGFKNKVAQANQESFLSTISDDFDDFKEEYKEESEEGREDAHKAIHRHIYRKWARQERYAERKRKREELRKQIALREEEKRRKNKIKEEKEEAERKRKNKNI